MLSSWLTSTSVAFTIAIAALGKDVPPIEEAMSDSSSEARIKGGFRTTPGAIPFVCSIQQRIPAGAWSWTRTHLCGSTIVNENWLLTSAHCVHQKHLGTLLVVCGLRQVRSLGQITVNPDYVGGQRGNDIALILLRKSLVFTENVQAIPIFDQSVLPSNKALIVGYGASSSNDAPGPRNGLQAAVVPIIAYQECVQRLGTLAAYLTPDVICTDNGQEAAGTCIGDSGGPVIIATDLYPFNVLAIPTWTVDPCGSGPSVHTLIAAHLDWILSIIVPIV
ncbi:chymotrypsinogen B-like isoform X1 [Uranotaenia lowii]|uniref:chymotrypsinogen B-like isoform X1 n=1 Tax=Uranotaenia lowii TaxID=190385 RepID=UPI002478E7A6|nr:chymotrypsinogen B-like isoform X1 [Uranotaenia lowii]